MHLQCNCPVLQSEIDLQIERLNPKSWPNIFISSTWKLIIIWNPSNKSNNSNYIELAKQVAQRHGQADLPLPSTANPGSKWLHKTEVSR